MPAERTLGRFCAMESHDRVQLEVNRYISTSAGPGGGTPASGPPRPLIGAVTRHDMMTRHRDGTTTLPSASHGESLSHWMGEWPTQPDGAGVRVPQDTTQSPRHGTTPWRQALGSARPDDAAQRGAAAQHDATRVARHHAAQQDTTRQGATTTRHDTQRMHETMTRSTFAVATTRHAAGGGAGTGA